MSSEIEAGGGVVVDEEGRVLLVHRPEYDDWSLPKGKLDKGESFEEAALREVEEETGVRCELVRSLPDVRYSVRGKPKVVRYWLMRVVSDSGFEPNSEVDEVRWVSPEEAVEVLTYDRDKGVVSAAVS
jgi:8-oxo-dGTP diphosphatase